MKPHIVTALRTTLVLLVIVSGIYPALVWAIGRVAFPYQAGGSLIERNGRIAGSELIGQPFASDRYFRSRPSAAGAGYDAMASGGSNLGPTSRKLRDRIAGERRAILAREQVGADQIVPADAVTASASGLDPHISPAYALLQVPRVARSRRMDERQLRSLVEARVEGRFLGVFGAPRVNVLLLNLALDDAVGGHGSRQ